MVQLEVRLRIKHEQRSQGMGRRELLDEGEERERKEKGRGELGWEPFTLCCDQRTEFRLEDRVRKEN